MTEVSIIIVAYKAKAALARCLQSIPKNRNYEIIVIDNSEENRGFSKACNLGAQKAKGNYLFFLNPDTEIFSSTIPLLLAKLKKDSSVGIVAPQFLNEHKKPVRNYSRQPRWYSAPFLFSFIKKFLPKKTVCALHSYECDSLDEEKYVEAVSGAAVFIEKKVFEVVDGFDEHFFMYWEDYDLSLKINQLGKRVLFYPQAKIIHKQGGATTNKVLAQKWFQQSRYFYFKKIFGSIYASFLEGFLRLTEAV